MISDDVIKRQIKFTLSGTDFKNLGKKYQGKVRDVIFQKIKFS